MSINKDMKKHMILIWITTTIYIYVLVLIYENFNPIPTSPFSFYILQCWV